jgi:molybdopterin synthase catalytic subunit
LTTRIRQVYNGKERGKTIMIQQWIDEIKAKSPMDQLGMILIHNGIVRATSKEGKPVQGMDLSYDGQLLDTIVARYKKSEGIVDIRVWINQGKLSIGDDIMFVLVAGRFRTDILPVFQELIREIKNNVVIEKET